MRSAALSSLMVPLLGLCLTACQSKPSSALSWDKVPATYPERLAAARAAQLAQAQAAGQLPRAVWQQTETALDLAIGEVLAGRLAESRGESHPLAALSLRQWRVEELLLRYHPALSQELQRLDRLAANPAVLTMLLQNLELGATGGVNHGYALVRRGEQDDDMDLGVRSNTTTSYGTAGVGTRLSLREFFPDTRARLEFELELMKFYHALSARHRVLWPVVEELDPAKPTDQADRAKRLKDLILGTASH